MGSGGNGSIVSSEAVKRSLVVVPGANLLGLIVVSMMFSFALLHLKKECAPIINMIHSLSKVVLLLVSVFMWTTPVGICSLIIGNLLEVDDFVVMLQRVGLFVITVIVGLSLHLLVTLTGLYFVIVRKNPLVFLYNIAPAMATALGTSSSSATLPMTFHCLENRAGLNAVITRLVLPLGTVINMDGGALYEALAAIYIAHINQFHLSIAEYVTIVIASIASSIGAPSIPAAGMVTTILVFTSIGLPVEHIAIIYSVDWFLDRFRTMVNVCGDSFGCAIIQSLCHSELSAAKQNSIRRTRSPSECSINRNTLKEHHNDPAAAAGAEAGGKIPNGSQFIFSDITASRERHSPSHISTPITKNDSNFSNGNQDYQSAV